MWKDISLSICTPPLPPPNKSQATYPRFFQELSTKLVVTGCRNFAGLWEKSIQCHTKPPPGHREERIFLPSRSKCMKTHPAMLFVNSIHCKLWTCSASPHALHSCILTTRRDNTHLWSLCDIIQNNFEGNTGELLNYFRDTYIGTFRRNAPRGNYSIQLVDGICLT